MSLQSAFQRTKQDTTRRCKNRTAWQALLHSPSKFLECLSDQHTCVWPGMVTDAQHFWHSFFWNELHDGDTYAPGGTPDHGNKGHANLTLPQYFHRICIQQCLFQASTYHFIFFQWGPTNYQDYWLTTFSDHLTHESMTPTYYTLLDPHNLSSMTLDPEDEDITVIQYAGN